MASLSDVVKGIQSTNELLVENVKGQNRTAAMITSFVTGQQSSFGDRLEAGRESGKSTKATARPTRGSGGPQGFRAGVMKGSGLSTLLGFGGKLISMLFTGVAGTAILGTIAGIAGTAFGAIGMTAILILAVKTFGNKLLETIFDKIDPGKMIITDENKKSISDSLTSATVLGLLAWLISPKLAIATFFASIITDIAMSYLTPASKKLMKEEVIKGMKEKVGFTITYEGLFKFGVALAGLFGMSLITSAFGLALTGSAVGLAAAGGIGASRPMRGILAKAFRRGFGAKLGLALMVPALGRVIGAKIAEATNTDEKIGNLIGDVLSAAVMGAMIGGPYGALIAVAGVLAFSLFKHMEQYVVGKEQELNADLAATIAELEAKKAAGIPLRPEDITRLAASKYKLSQSKFTEQDRQNLQMRVTGQNRARALYGAIGNNIPTSFKNVHSGKLYKGIHDDLNPYKPFDPRFKQFKDAAIASAEFLAPGSIIGPDRGGRSKTRALELKKAEIENAISNLSLAAIRGPGSGDNLGLVFGPILKAVSASVQAMDIIAATLRENNMGHTTVVAGNQKVSTVETLYNMHGHSGFGSMGIGQRGRQTP
jgi:hypothetical protein